MKFFYTTLLLFVVITPGFAQKQNNKWYFGNFAALDFNSGSPVQITTSKLFAWEACASIADKKTGKLLFYTNGYAVYDTTNNVMPNGNRLGGDTSTTQTLIVPKPGSTTIYYIFALANEAGYFSHGDSGLNVSIVDMSLHGGLGDVTTKDSLLLTPTTEKVTSTLACNAKDVWVVTHQWNTDAFYAYLITSNGISAPVISHSGIVHKNVGSIGNYEAIGGMKISPNGKKLALACNSYLNTVQVFDFDNATGIVSNPLTDTNYPYIFDGDGPYQVSFSPDNTKLYVSYDYNEYTNGQVYQYTLLSGSENDFIVSREPVAPDTSIQLGDMQIGPDGKIYVAKVGLDSLDVISNPNGYQSGCNYTVDDVYLGSRLNFSTYGLPNINVSYLGPVFTLTYTNCSANGRLLTLTDSAVTGSATAYWNFGDPASGTADTSTLQNAYHTFSKDGNFTITLIVNTNCQLSDTIRKTIYVNWLRILPASPIALCSGRSITLIASGETSYLWIPSNGLSTSTGASVTATPTTSLYYKVVGDSAGCIDTAYAIINLYTSPDLNVMPTYGNVCNGRYTFIRASGADSYIWSPTSTLSIDTGSMVYANPTTTTTYKVVGRDGSCRDTLQSILIVNLSPSLNILPSSPVICNGQSINLIAGIATTFQWSPSAGLNSTNGDTVMADPAATTTYTVIGAINTCMDTAEAVVTVNAAVPLVIIPQSPSICYGQSVVLLADTTGKNYVWSPVPGLNSTTGDSVVANPSATVTYTVTGLDSVGCAVTDSDVVIINQLPVKPVITRDDDTLFSSYTTGNQWLLNDTVINGATGRYLIIVRNGSYSVTETDSITGCSSISDSTIVSATTAISKLLGNTNGLSVFPNPTGGEITIVSSSDIYGLTVSNVLGQIVIKLPSGNAGVKQVIDLSGRPSGVYFITVTNKTGSVVAPVVKQN